MNMQVSRAPETSRRQPCQEPWVCRAMKAKRSAWLALVAQWVVSISIRGREKQLSFSRVTSRPSRPVGLQLWSGRDA